MGLRELIIKVGGLVSNLIVLVAGVALLAFFWGLFKFILNASNEKAKDDGKSIMIWGVVALFLMVSVWGIIRFVQLDLGLHIQPRL
jgi:uncharacterized membrane protein YidH (DUF202 family)